MKVYIVFDRPPNPHQEFIDIVDEYGRSVCVGEWVAEPGSDEPTVPRALMLEIAEKGGVAGQPVPAPTQGQ